VRPRESVHIRPATIADVAVVARHRASMFRDMGSLADGLVIPLVDMTQIHLVRRHERDALRGRPDAVGASC
jgi:hypothetical protein